MNKAKLKKALLHMSNGRALKEIGQFIDMEWRMLRHELIEMGVESPADARRKLKQINDAEIALPVNKNDRSADRSGETVPEFKKESVEPAHNFDRAAAIVNAEKQKTQERIPQEKQKEFRRDLKDRPWVQIMRKWGEQYKLSEDLLMEQAMLLAPKTSKTRFGFGEDDNLEDRKALREE